MNGTRLKRILLALLACIGLVVGTAASGSAETRANHGHDGPHGHHGNHAVGYYLALGDSLAAGYQPGVGDDRTGGYAGHVLTALRADHRRTALVNLACSGETTGTMATGGICSYKDGNQLAQAVAFLRTHRGQTRLVTLDIGANDVDGCVTAGSIDVGCVQAGLGSVTANLPRILSRLRAAAGPRVRIEVLNYYDPFLAAWLTGPAGQSAAAQSLQLSGTLNGIISTSSAAVHGRTVDIAAAFHSQDATLVALPPFGQVPTDVATICTLTWMCTLGNIHANDAGYAVMGAAVAARL